MRTHIIIMSTIAATLICGKLRAEDDVTTSLIAVARACGDLAVAANPNVDLKIVPDKARDIFAQCKMQWRRVAIVMVENEANDKVVNFHNRRDAQRLYQQIDATSIRLESDEEARLRNAMRAAALQSTPKQR